MTNIKEQPRCYLCGTNHGQIIETNSPNGDIHFCSDCIRILYQLIQVKPVTKDSHSQPILTPKEIHQALNQSVIGQEHAKKVISVAVYNHWKRIHFNISTEKNNILLVGPSGSGKTLFAKTLAKLLNVPFVIADATRFTEAGYIGDDVESCITDLYLNANEDIEKTQHGIVYIDEIDKIARKSADNPSITRDVSGEGVQNALLKIIEGTIVDVPVSKGKRIQGKTVAIDTSNILFICGGAFSNIDTDKKESVIGFMKEGRTENTIRKKTTDDFTAFGMTPEFMGRLPVIAELKELKKEELVQILTDTNHSLIPQYQDLLFLDGIELIFTEECLEEIAEEAITRKIGARGLKSILEEMMLDIMYEAPSEAEIQRYTMTADSVHSHKPQITYNRQA